MPTKKDHPSEVIIKVKIKLLIKTNERKTNGQNILDYIKRDDSK